MAYDTGNFSLFNESQNFTTVFADLKAPLFNPNGVIFGTVAGSFLSPTVATSGSGTIGSFYGLQIAPTLTAAGGTVSVAYSLNISGPSVFTGTIGNVYSLYVTPSTVTAGTIVNNYTAYFGGTTGIGTTTPQSALSVLGSVAVGTYAGVFSAPSNGMIVTGRLGVGNSSPAFAADISGIASATRIYAGGTTENNQLVGIFEGNNQGGFGGGSVGTIKTMSANTTVVFDTRANVNSNSAGFYGGVFDGRYIYFVPSINQTTTFSGQITRFDTTQSFGVSTSYAVFDTAANVSTASVGFVGGIFDGRYVYFVPNRNLITYSGQITRYDTTAPFGLSSSYAVFDTRANVSASSLGFAGAVFDGRYIYFVPNFNGTTYFGQITRYDTSVTFGTSTSYAVFDTQGSVNGNSKGFLGGTYDGRYVYLVPNAGGSLGQITQYDTTLSFTAAGSYAVFDTKGSLNSNSAGFSSGIFDGRYIYFIPLINSTAFGQITRYDTTLSFGTATSYSIFDTKANVSTSSAGFAGGSFDGRYLYLVPFNNGTTYFGQITRYDTTQFFGGSGSYAVFDTKANISQNSAGFQGSVYDGRYVYLVPQNNGTASGQITRLDAYSGPLASSLVADWAVNGFSIGIYAGLAPPANGMIVSGNVGIGVSSPSVALDITGGVLSATHIYTNGTTFNNQLVGLFEGNNQGGFGSGSVGTGKTMSANTTQIFDVSAINSLATGFGGAIFDGRFVYLIPFKSATVTASSQVIRYDTESSFLSSSSYATYNTNVINTASAGFFGAVFDGRYLYFIPYSVGNDLTFSGLITRFDTTASFTSSSSYSVFDTAVNVNSNSVGFQGGVFDGRYVYCVPYTNNLTVSGQITRYDTTLTFGTSTSYAVFDTAANVNSNSAAFAGGAFDGRYVYLLPYNDTTYSGQITQYDTTLSFTAASSYAVFDTAANVNSNSQGFFSGVFDGRYIYLVPSQNSVAFVGQITRYDTTQPFGAASSYAVFNTAANVSSNSCGFSSAVFDGRYVYYTPYENNTTFSGVILRYDTTLPFQSNTSYALFNAASVNSNSVGFFGSIFDGRYVYMVPETNSVGTSGSLLTRLDAYPGQLATAITAAQASNGFTVGAYAGLAPPTNGLLVSGNVGIGVSSPASALDVTGGIVSATRVYTSVTTANNQTVGLFEGNNQGGYGGGSVGTQKTMSANTTVYFDTLKNVSTASCGFNGSIFDGRYLYFIPYQNVTLSGQVTRFDTTLSFFSASSYVVFDTAVNLSTKSAGFTGGVFDGRYVYFVPNSSGAIFGGQITRYDTTASFTSSSSYSVFDTGLYLNSNSVGFTGGVFDGRYVYLIPYSNSIVNTGQITRYDTTLPFGTSTSYAIFNTTGVNGNSKGFAGGGFDGRYVYLVPNAGGSLGQITQYDTTLPFSTGASYAFFDTAANLNSASVGFAGSVFDGRFLYLIPETFNLITRYDTTLPFGTASSYAIFNIGTNLNLNVLFLGGQFDGRYIYFVPNNNSATSSGLVLRFDTIQAFSVSASYTFFDTKANVNSLSAGFYGAGFDGRYVYLVPNVSQSGTSSGQITRLDAYPGPQATVILASQAANGFSIGTSVGAPSNGLLVTGNVGIGTSSPAAALDVSSTGTINASRVYQSGTTFNNQLIGLSQGNNQSSFGGGSVGTQKTMNANGALGFDLQLNLGSSNNGFGGAVFDGRFLYLIPFLNTSGFPGPIVRYDTTLPFLSSLSYLSFTPPNISNTNSYGFVGAVFDGRYIYFIPYYNGQITRYDTTVTFGATSSYAIFDTAAKVNSNSVGFEGGVFDGRYVYLVPYSNSQGNLSGQITRYDTTLSFQSSSSYSVFDTGANVNSNSVGFAGGAYDGRYVYLLPYNGSPITYSGQITQYDTTLPFTSASSYAVFDTAGQVNTNSRGFFSGVFDGRFLYLVPYINSLTYSGQITRYDTTLPFGSSSSYSIFNAAASINSNSCGFDSAVFDGRYIYFAPYMNNTAISGQVLRYDTTLSFSASGSYALFNTAVNVNSNSVGFFGSVYDGRYVYLIPSLNSLNTSGGLLTRLDAYPGPLATTISASQAPNGFSVGTLAGTASQNNLIVGGEVGVGSSSPTAALSTSTVINAQQQVIAAGGTTRVNQIVSLFEGNNQGGFSTSSVGTQKTMSQNTTVNFNLALVNGNSKDFLSAVFDGRFIYFVPMTAGVGLITRYDTALLFSSSASYATYDLQANVNTACQGFGVGLFDGRYVYYTPNTNLLLTQYDTTLPFTSSSSYATFVFPNNLSGASVIQGGIFDGRYLYFPTQTTPIIQRYDTTLPFSASTSYATYNDNSGNSYYSGTFDGRYIYYTPFESAFFMQYDTTQSFTSAAAYASFRTDTNVNSNATGFTGTSTFDGRYVYSVTYPNTLILRYDTTLPFSNSASYAFSTFSAFPFTHSVYDGRYVYFSEATASNNVTRYDTTQSFTAAGSYTTLLISTGGFSGLLYDGRYIYSLSLNDGNINRLDAYPGPQATALNAASAPNGLTLLGGGTLALTSTPTAGSATGGTAATLPAQAAGYLSITVNGTIQKIPYYNL